MERGLSIAYSSLQIFCGSHSLGGPGRYKTVTKYGTLAPNAKSAPNVKSLSGAVPTSGSARTDGAPCIRNASGGDNGLLGVTGQRVRNVEIDDDNKKEQGERKRFFIIKMLYYASAFRGGNRENLGLCFSADCGNTFESFLFFSKQLKRRQEDNSGNWPSRIQSPVESKVSGGE